MSEWMNEYEYMYFLFHAIFNTIFHSVLCQEYFNSKFLRERESAAVTLGQVSLLCPVSCVQEIRTNGPVLTQQEFWALSPGRVLWVWPAVPLNSLRNRVHWKIVGDQVSRRGSRVQRVCWFFLLRPWNWTEIEGVARIGKSYKESGIFRGKPGLRQDK